MNELQKTQSNLPVKIIGVFSKPNALQEAEQTLINAIDKAVLTCYFELNQNVPNQTDRTVLVNKILDSILDRYTSIRADEIAEAFSNGVRKHYGEYFGLCLISFEQFIKGYLESEKRKCMAKEYIKSQSETKNEPSIDEKFTTAKGLCLEAFEKVKQGKSIGLTAVAVYTFLNDIQLIDPDYKKGIMPQALEELVKEKEAEAINCFELLKRRRLNADLELLKLNIQADGITSGQYNECKRVGKRIILNNWMRDIILNEDNLSELIDGKRLFYKSK